MAGERINLATLDLDVQDLIKKATESKQSLIALRSEQAELKKSGQEGSEQFVRNEVEMRNLTATYRLQTTAIQAQVSEGGRLQNAQMSINEATSRLNQTENEYRANNTLLLKLRKDLNINDADYKKNLDAINAKLDANNEFIKENVSGYEKQKIGIGDYKTAIKEAINDTGVFGGSLGALKADFDQVVNITKSFAPILGDLKGRWLEVAKSMGLFKTAQDAATAATTASTAATEAATAAAATQAAAEDTLAASTAAVVVETDALAVSEAAAAITTEAQAVATGSLVIAEEAAIGTTGLLIAETEALAVVDGIVATETAILTGETAALAATQVAGAGASTVAAGATGILSGALAILQLVLDSLGIGLILLALVLLIAAFRNFTPLIDLVEQGLAAMGAAFKVVLNAVIALVTGAASLGDAFSGLGSDMDEAASSAVKLKKAQQDLEDQMKLQEIATARNRAEINRLNIQAKDRTKSEEERLALLKKASQLEDDDYNARKKNADEQYRQALEQAKLDANLSDAEFAKLKEITDLQINSDANLTAKEQDQLNARASKYKEFLEDRTGGVDDLYKTIEDAQKKELELDSEYYTNMEKNINKQNKLIEDADKAREDAAKAQEKRQADAEKAETARQKKIQDALDMYTEKLKLQLQLFEQVQGEKFKSVDEEIKQAEKLRDKNIEIAQAQYNASKKTANDLKKLRIATNDAQLKLMATQTDAVVKNAENEYTAIIAANQSKLDNNKFLNDEMVKQELARLDVVSQAERDRAQVDFDNKIISQQALDIELAKIDDENQKSKVALAQQRKEAQQAADVADIENKKIVAGINYQYDLDAQLADYDKQRAIQREAALKMGADMLAFDAATADGRKKIEQTVQDNKLALASATFANLSNIAGRESALGKALAIAQTTIDTYRGATSAFASLATIVPYGPVLGAAAAAAAIVSGLANVKKIASTKTPKAERGALFGIGGKRHSAGGTLFTGADGTRFEAEQGELIGVMNRNAAAHFMAFNNAFPAGGSSGVSNYLASGGMVSREIRSSASDVLSLDYDLLASKIGAQTAIATSIAVSNMPAPVVSVHDIVDVNSRVVNVRSGANL